MCRKLLVLNDLGLSCGLLVKNAPEMHLKMTHKLHNCNDLRQVVIQCHDYGNTDIVGMKQVASIVNSNICHAVQNYSDWYGIITLIG